MADNHNPKDFTSSPGATMESVRREQAGRIRHYAGYLNNCVEEGKRMGLATTLALSGQNGSLEVRAIEYRPPLQKF